MQIEMLVKIYSSLICQDLPEFLEDHSDEFMTLLHGWLQLGAEIASRICEILIVYAKVSIK